MKVCLILCFAVKQKFGDKDVDDESDSSSSESEDEDARVNFVILWSFYDQL